MDKIMILGAGEHQLHLIERAKERGFYTIAVSPDGDYPGLKAADKVYLHDAMDVEFITETARAEGVRGITSDQSEIFVRPIAYACDALGLPGNPPEVAELYTDKGMMRRRGKELGLATIESYTADTYEEAAARLVEIGARSIIKPLDGFSSRGVYQIDGEDDLKVYFPLSVSQSRCGKVIIERYVEGRVLEVDSIALDGRVEPLMWGEIWDFGVANVFSSRLRLYPIVEEKDSVPALLEYNRKINEGFGIKQGITHNEYMLERGTGEIYLIEAALRSGGAMVGSTITELQTGLDTTDFNIDASMGIADRLPEYEQCRCHCGTVAFYIPIGTVLSLDGLAEVEALDYVRETTFGKLREGFVSSKIEDKDQRQLMAVCADSREELMARIDHIKDLIKIQVRTPDGIRGPIWE